MNPFSDDPFGEDPFDIFREFFGERPSRRYKKQIIQGEEEERVIDLIETDKKAYLIFELPGFEEEEISINVSGNFIEIIAKKKDMNEVKDYLINKLSQVIRYKKTLPNFVNGKKFSYTQRNGILEVVFSKR
ncbi:MAG: Hsp20/alpha crystallin family protein [Candidatus Pacearchaeota archaeon]